MPTGVAPIDTVAVAGARKRVEHAESVPGSGATRSCLQSMCSSSHASGVVSVGAIGLLAVCGALAATALVFGLSAALGVPSLTALDLPEARFDAVFCNACLYDYMKNGMYAQWYVFAIVVTFDNTFTAEEVECAAARLRAGGHLVKSKLQNQICC